MSSTKATGLDQQERKAQASGVSGIQLRRVVLISWTNH